MGHTSPTNRILCSRPETIINATKHLAIQNLHCLRVARKLTKKKVIKGSIIQKLRKNIMQPVHSPYCQKLCTKLMPTTAAVPLGTNSIVTTYSYQQNYSYPLTMNDWSHLQTPLFTIRPVPVPVIIPTSRPIFTPITPLIGAVVQPMLSPMIPQTFVQEHVGNISNYTTEYNYSTELFDNVADVSNDQSYYLQEDIVIRTADVNSLNNILDTSLELQSSYVDLESYLTLPKELFPKPSMLSLDPNPIIDEFCKMPNIQLHMPWILDLEFGIPKSPITRLIPTYNVKFNSIHCKNAPNAIHPGFESCDPDFKKVMLFYYDCIISAWYKGYVIMHSDRSVENFQSWLLRPMHVLGMCWP